jgi:hypothetical protein
MCKIKFASMGRIATCRIGRLLKFGSGRRKIVPKIIYFNYLFGQVYARQVTKYR